MEDPQKQNKLLKVFKIFNGEPSPETPSEPFDQAKITEANNSNRNNIVAATLAISAWMVFLSSIIYHSYKMDYYAKLMLSAQNNEEQLRIEKAANITQDSASITQTIMGTIAGTITGFYFASNTKRNSDEA